MEYICNEAKICHRQCEHKKAHELKFNSDLLEDCNLGMQSCIDGRRTQCFPVGAEGKYK